MEFKKKLKVRLWLAIIYMMLGLAMIVCFNVRAIDNEFFSSFGLVLFVIGLAKLRQYLAITKNEDSLKKREIMENDERNVSIVNRARSVSFIVYVILVSVAVIVLYMLNYFLIAKILSYSICALVFIYWIAYFIIRKIS